MGMELINRITIKKNGVYLSSHSINDSAPFISHKIGSLSAVYKNGGQKELDKEIIKMLSGYAALSGNHPSVQMYRDAMKKARDLPIHAINLQKISEKYDTLTSEDLKSEFTSHQTKAMRDYLDYEEEQDNLKYAAIAELVIHPQKAKRVSSLVSNIESKNNEIHSIQLTFL